MEENQQGEQQEMEQAIQPIVEMGSSTIRPAAVQSMSSPSWGRSRDISCCLPPARARSMSM